MAYSTLKDTINGPAWTLWIIFAIFAVLSVILLTGHGSFLIAGYNTSRPEKKAEYNEKRLCRVTGVGLLVIAAMILVMIIGINVLPAFTANIFGGIVIADAVVMIILMNTICKR